MQYLYKKTHYHDIRHIINIMRHIRLCTNVVRTTVAFEYSIQVRSMVHPVQGESGSVRCRKRTIPATEWILQKIRMHIKFDLIIQDNKIVMHIDMR